MLLSATHELVTAGPLPIVILLLTSVQQGLEPCMVHRLDRMSHCSLAAGPCKMAPRPLKGAGALALLALFAACAEGSAEDAAGGR